MFCPNCKYGNTIEKSTNLKSTNINFEYFKCKKCNTVFSLNEKLELFIEDSEELIVEYKEKNERNKNNNISKLKFANEEFATDMLIIYDTLKLAILNITKEEEKEGVLLTLKNLLNVFEKHNIKLIKLNNKIFDSNISEAIMKVENKHKNNNEINEVISDGFTYNGRLLRAAKVSIVDNTI